MNKMARLIDDLRAAHRGEIAFESVTGRISAHLLSSPDAANDMLRQVETAYEQRIIAPEQFARLKTVIVHTINSRRDNSQVPSTNGVVSRSNIAIGTRLRERFILDEVLGVGGMGTVYKGRDLLKVEARDRNPFVAIKVLNDDFKKRDDAFIVLQREASRQQRLAHPNIVTVYDFDRTGDIIFISMELLEGAPLDAYLKTHGRPRNGLPFKEALPLIEGMCAALTYAHERGIVHADFKPSNSFVLLDGSIKVLDFGIARAMKKPNQVESDLTVYDGRSLGAMTPAYASPEMLEHSGDPDARDDVYALACVCYEVLTGWHPFNRASALDARDQKLVPKRIPGLSARQNRALVRALAFEREARTPNVRDFINELGNGTKAAGPWNKKIVGAAVAIALAAIAGGAWYAERYPVTSVIADLQSGNGKTAQAAIDRLATFSPEDRAEVLKKARPAIVAHFHSQVQSMLDSGEIDAASAKAEAMLRSGLTMYPDATELTTLLGEVGKRRERYLSELAEQYETYLAAGRLLRSSAQGDIQGVMRRIRLVDPEHPLLSDPRVPGAFAAAAEAAIVAGKLDAARELLSDGTALAPNDGVLRDVGDKLAGADQRLRISRRTGELVAQIDGQVGSLTGLAALTPTFIDAIVELHGIDPGNAVLTRVRSAVRPLLGKDYQLITDIATIDNILAMERSYSGAFDAMGLSDAVTRVRAHRDALSTQRNKLLAQARALVANPGTKTADGMSIGGLIGELRKLAPADPELTTVVTAAASEQRRVAQRLSAEHEWTAARGALAEALTLDSSPEMKTLIAQDIERVAERERDSARESAEAERVVARTVERMKIDEAARQLQTAVDNFAPSAAGLAALGPKIFALAALDPGNQMIQSARSTAAQRIATAATQAAQAGKFDDAQDLLGKAAVDLPGVAAIAQARTQLDTLQIESTRRAQNQIVTAAQEKFRTTLERPGPTQESWQRDADAALTALQKVATPADAATARQQLAAIYLDMAGRLLTEKRFTIAAQLLDKAEALTPKALAVQTRRDQLALATERNKTERAAEELAAKLNATRQRFSHEINSRQFERARKTLTELQSTSGKDDAFATREAPLMLTSAYITTAQAMLKSGDINAAWQLARAGAPVAGDDPRFNQLRADIDTAASRRVDSLLSSPGAMDRAALTSLVAQYRTASPDRYRALNPGWVTRIQRRLADLAADPAAHNSYLAAAKIAFADVTVLQSVRPAEIRTAAIESRPVPAPAAAATTSPTTASNSAPPPLAVATSTPSIAPATAPVPTPAVAANLEPSLIGNWCGEGVGLNFEPSTYAFDIGGGRIIKYPVERYQRTNTTITMTWADKTLGAMVTEFGEFSADGQSMVQMRGKTANSPDWKSYNRKFKRCK